MVLEDRAGAHGDSCREGAIAGGQPQHLSGRGRRAADAREWRSELAQLPGLMLLAGRYEGVDERLIEAEIDESVSIGDYVLSGGELPALVLIDAVVRLLPGVLGDDESALQDSFVAGLLDWPHYTRPEVFEGRAVPEVLASGNHAAIRRWRDEAGAGPHLAAAAGSDREADAERRSSSVCWMNS